MSCGVGRRCSLNLVLLWLWPRMAAEALIQPLAWELSYAAGVALKRPKQTNKQTKNKNKKPLDVKLNINMFKMFKVIKGQL